MSRRDGADAVDLGIDTTPRGPSGPPRPRPSAGWDFAWLGRFARWAGGLVGLAVLGLVAEAFLEQPPAAPTPDPATVRVRATLDRMTADRLAREAASAANAGPARLEALATEADPAVRDDRKLWREASPEGMALAWARRARPGEYRVTSARKLMYVLVAFLEDEATGRPYSLRAQLGPEDTEAKVQLLEAKPE